MSTYLIRSFNKFKRRTFCNKNSNNINNENISTSAKSITLNSPNDDKLYLGLLNHKSGSLISIANTISDLNWSNVSELRNNLVLKSTNSNNEKMDKKIDLSKERPRGHVVNKPDPHLNDVILRRKYDYPDKKFTPPLFTATGIEVCPEPRKIPQKRSQEEIKPVEKVPSSSLGPNVGMQKKLFSKSLESEGTNKSHPVKSYSSVLEDDVLYKTPGNMEFIDFTYPLIGNNYRYTTYAIPKYRQDWEWMLKHIDSIQNLFKRKYRSRVYLSNKPIKYKGHYAYIVCIESHLQHNILQCRAGLPDRLKEMLYYPPNSKYDTECYATEYLIKRKHIFYRLHLGLDEIEHDDRKQLNKIVTPDKPQGDVASGRYGGNARTRIRRKTRDQRRQLELRRLESRRMMGNERYRSKMNPRMTTFKHT